MKKVRIMHEGYAPDLERRVNEFIEDKNVTDIQYQAATAYSTLCHSVMIVYEEKSDDTEKME